jgi:hypothetical protein
MREIDVVDNWVDRYEIRVVHNEITRIGIKRLYLIGTHLIRFFIPY